ncbi:SubName: Full=Uncharacterized protein {ECO:0000313/EMBL:CCA68291.1} [Serendipita indica DSM 11827]|uniref:Uncharacterized protein n=1 Tax=Serendipita indica (strain DSM 11827) TaxID=1109443 RepID=G4TAF2_SERID|nr:SubName: Full=Uncharacterized protein {ECO:0000313/EMBL:CCA68291.1} [Serendipita indica DSM 11827]CCA68291.1 hypothetical protein PIIN_02155 [Serendipita indica DSM 11827]
MSHRPPPKHEGVIIDDIAEERAARAKQLKEDFPGSRNVPSTGLRLPESTKAPESNEQKGQASSPEKSDQT